MPYHIMTVNYVFVIIIKNKMKYVNFCVCICHDIYNKVYIHCMYYQRINNRCKKISKKTKEI